MLFSSREFILGFLPVCLCGFFALGRLGGRRWALGWLLLTSLFFYGWWAPRFVALLLGSVAFNLLLGRHVSQLAVAGRESSARTWLIFGISTDLALLGWFKYANFLLTSFGAMAGVHLPTLNLFLPLAISFFTFQQILFLLDCRARPEIAGEGLS